MGKRMKRGEKQRKWMQKTEKGRSPLRWWLWYIDTYVHVCLCIHWPCINMLFCVLLLLLLSHFKCDRYTRKSKKKKKRVKNNEEKKLILNMRFFWKKLKQSGQTYGIKYANSCLNLSIMVSSPWNKGCSSLFSLGDPNITTTTKTRETRRYKHHIQFMLKICTSCID